MIGINEKKVLIVEDTAGLQKVLAERINALGVDATGVGTGQEAITFIKNEKPQLVLLDIMLPGGMNGFDVLKQMHADPELKKIPVIVLTNLDTEQKTATDLGAVDYVVKTNISLDDVIEKIKSRL